MVRALPIWILALALAGCSQDNAAGPPDGGNAKPPVSAPSPPDQGKTGIDEGTFEILGTVRFKDLEGGFFAIDADDGRKYDPTNLPETYRKDGLRVRLRARPRTGIAGFRMYGQIIDVITIEEQ